MNNIEFGVHLQWSHTVYTLTISMGDIGVPYSNLSLKVIQYTSLIKTDTCITEGFLTTFEIASNNIQSYLGLLVNGKIPFAHWDKLKPWLVPNPL